ncbi:DUF3558 family protein [Corynebacterium glaucum]|nr:DUF3558 family protein [Corynebacterium glaucum]
MLWRAFDNLEVGGLKASGLGREGVKEGMLEYSEAKMIGVRDPHAKSEFAYRRLIATPSQPATQLGIGHYRRDRVTFWGTELMRKIGTTVLLLALALAGCTVRGDGQLAEPAFTEVATDSPDGNSPNETVTPAAGSPRAFVFESGVLEFGDFDPYALGDDLFDPCTEITEAEYAEAGFERLPEFDSINELSGLSYCEIASDSDFVVKSFSNGSLNRRMLEEAAVVHHRYTSTLLPEIIVYGPKDGVEGDCYTQVDTLRGGVGAAVGGMSRRVSQDDICRIAIDMTEQLFIAHGSE